MRKLVIIDPNLKFVIKAIKLINYCFKFERALSHSSEGRGVDQLLVAENGDALL